MTRLAISNRVGVLTIQMLVLALVGLSSRPGLKGATTITVRAGENLQAAVDKANYGDTVILEAGATFTGPLYLRNKGGINATEDFVTIRTSDLSGIAQAGERVSADQARFMPKIVAPNAQAAISTEPQAHHYKFIGIEFAPSVDAKYVHSVIDLGRSDYTSLSQYPHHLVFDRVYIHSTGLNKARRGIALNSGETSILNSYISGFAGFQDETQAIAGWNGPGPFHIVNNFLQAAGEVIMFGGADPSITGLVPSDIEIRANYLTKSKEWIGRATVKATFELKNAKRVTVNGNLMESEILTTAIVLTPRNQSGTAEWSTIEDVEITNNIVRHASTGINILGTDNERKSQVLRRLRIANNLLTDLTPDDPNNNAYFIQINGSESVLIEHNTVQQKGDPVRVTGRPQGFIFRDNIVHHNSYGITCFVESPRCQGPLCQCLSTATIKGNVIIDNLGLSARESIERKYPSGNFFPRSIDAVGFVDYQRGDWRLSPGSRYRGKATDLKDPGMDSNSTILAGAENAKVGRR